MALRKIMRQDLSQKKHHLDVDLQCTSTVDVTGDHGPVVFAPLIQKRLPT